jgi:uncharacterized tellurite resistance protein B-like protein
LTPAAGARYNVGMTRPRDFLDVLEAPGSEPLRIDDTAGALLLHLIVHIFFADERLDDRELQLIAGLVGEESDELLRERITELGSMTVSFEKLAETFPDRQDRLDIITLAEHAWWADNQLEPAELDIADQLADLLDIHER